MKICSSQCSSNHCSNEPYLLLGEKFCSSKQTIHVKNYFNDQGPREYNGFQNQEKPSKPLNGQLYTLGKKFPRLEPQCLFLSATSCTIKLKIWPIALRILIITTISRIFSLIVQGVADRNKRCGS